MKNSTENSQTSLKPKPNLKHITLVLVALLLALAVFSSLFLVAKDKPSESKNSVNNNSTNISKNTSTNMSENTSEAGTKVGEELEKSDLVFRGTLLEVDEEASYADGPVKYKFSITKQWKGESKSEVVIQHFLFVAPEVREKLWAPENKEAAGQEFIIFARKSGNLEEVDTFLFNLKPTNNLSLEKNGKNKKQFEILEKELDQVNKQ